MPAFFIILFTLYFVGNTYIFFRGWQTLAAAGKGIKIGYGIIYFFLVFLFMGQFGLRNLPEMPALGHVLHQVGTGWLVFSLYMTIWLLLTEMVWCIGRLRKARWATEATRCKQFRSVSFWNGFLLIICILSIGYYRYQHPYTEVINIVINKSITSDKKQIKVVAVSDIHLGYGTDKQQLQRYVQLINAQHPDLILIGGDLIDNSVVPLRIENMQEELSALHAPLGVYMASGNHEYIAGIDASEAFVQETSIQFLRDSVITLPNGIQLAGRDDRYNKTRLSLPALLANTVAEKPLIVLDHQPYELAQTVAAGVDLQFSGHTHQGQIWPISLFVDQLFEISHGMKIDGDSHIYVSSGLSLWGPPFRIGTRSELVVFNLCFK